ncbi:hypothetical protein ABZZ20_17605 [Streptomyces sp. NPDC006430]|uniref:DUF3303 family protein n=1 Tax=Streptomyces sp. NPDC006430 TaxID=3154299 RepID=UPI0033AA268B
MRVMLRAHMDTQAGNEAIKNGGLPRTMKELMEKVKPEAAYFGLSEGVRSCWIVFDLQNSEDLPPLVEDLFSQLHAEIEVQPVMNADDLEKGLAALKSARP